MPPDGPQTPLTLKDLHLLCQGATVCDWAPFDVLLFQAMLTLSFHGFLHPGEMTESPNSILFENVYFSDQKVLIKMLSYKHSKGKQVTLSIKATKSKFCPVATLYCYVARRPTCKNLFCDKFGKFVSYNRYSKMFSQVVYKCGLSPYLEPHSARIGAATHAAIARTPSREWVGGFRGCRPLPMPPCYFPLN